MLSIRSVKPVAFTAIIILSVFGAIFYGSCSKDSCKGVTCLNYGTCSGGACTCPDGIGGGNCEQVYRKIYASGYAGNATYSSSMPDTSFKAHGDTSNTLTFIPGTDTVNFNEMQVAWAGHVHGTVTMDILLANNSASGSSFTITPVTVDTFTFSGSGSVSGTTASLNLKEAHPNSPSVVITLSNFTKQ